VSRNYTPTVLHTSRDGVTYLCGPKPEGSWHDRCMANRFIETLPLCEACETISEESKARTALAVTLPTGILSGNSIIDFDDDVPVLKNERIYVCDYRRE